jgi:tetratricopeptide (TPR) repeat protein
MPTTPTPSPFADPALSGPGFGPLMRTLRCRAGLSFGQLAELVRYDRSYLHHVEAGRKAGERTLAEALDAALTAGGALVSAWDREEAVRIQEAATRRTLAASLATTRDLMELAELDLDDLHSGVLETAVDYLATPPAPMLHRADVLRRDALRRLKTRHHRPSERADLYVLAGRLSGILAYAALDLGSPDAALDHAAAAGRCAEYAGDAELAAWTAGTQSLIARFQGDYGRAKTYIEAGFEHVGDGTGTGEARLLCGLAQCAANLGDSPAANRALDEATDARARMRRPDTVSGLFGFSQAKELYYAGSSLIWLEGGHDARRAIASAETAITLWESGPPEERSLDDERLAHIYAATAYVQLGELEAAVTHLQPILDLPADQQISWIIKRAGRIADILDARRYAHDPLAEQTIDAIRTLTAA